MVVSSACRCLAHICEFHCIGFGPPAKTKSDTSGPVAVKGSLLPLQKSQVGIRLQASGLLKLLYYPPIMENQMEKKMEHEMETGGI